MPAYLRVGLGSPEPRDHETLLAETHFSATERSASNPRYWPLGLTHLSGARQESWLVSGQVHDSQQRGFNISDGNDWAWLGTELICADGDDLIDASCKLFQTLHALTSELGKPYVARLWVVIPDIHGNLNNDDRYKHFCSGRQHAYQQLNIHAPHFPAATVVGSAHGPLRLHALACSRAGVALENPRQTPAYEYPKHYAPLSPTFSRALQTEELTFVSGTAAIHNSDSQHPGDPIAQMSEIDTNIAALSTQLKPKKAHPIQLEYGRIYVRREDDAAALQQHASHLWPQSSNWPVLQADICRQELLCEIETGIRT